jgi:hypothetical protein
MSALFSIFRTRQRLFSFDTRWTGCTPPTAAERMAHYSQRHAADMQARENAGAAAPKVRLVNGRPVLIALPGRVNVVPEHIHALLPSARQPTIPPSRRLNPEAGGLTGQIFDLWQCGVEGHAI